MRRRTSVFWLLLLLWGILIRVPVVHAQSYQNFQRCSEELCGPDAYCDASLVKSWLNALTKAASFGVLGIDYDSCLPKKTNGWGCDYDIECQSGFCLKRGGKNVCAPQGAQCQKSSDCPAGKVCANWKCVDTNKTCISDPDCKGLFGGEAYCGIAQGHSVCMPKGYSGDSCTSDSACRSGLKCINGRCAPEEYLLINSQPTQCDNATCSPLQYCKPKLFGGTCEDKVWDGFLCDPKLGGVDCLSGVCDPVSKTCVGKNAQIRVSASVAGLSSTTQSAPRSIDFGFVELSSDNWADFAYQLFFGLGVFLSLVMLIVNAIKLMVSGHNPEEVQKALKGIQQALLGLALVVMAAAIVIFINDTIVSMI